MKSFYETIKSDYRFFKYMFVDTWKIIRIPENKQPLMKTRVSLKINEVGEIYKKLLFERCMSAKPVWS